MTLSWLYIGLENVFKRERRLARAGLELNRGSRSSLTAIFIPVRGKLVFISLTSHFFNRWIGNKVVVWFRMKVLTCDKLEQGGLYDVDVLFPLLCSHTSLC